ncbi:Inositol oxygenase 2 [Glycine soja]
MFSLIEQPQPSRTQAEENNEHSQKITLGLVLDGDFPLLKPPSSHDGLIVPDINSNGRSFRNYYGESERHKSVKEFYRQQHIGQTYEFAKKMTEEYGKLNRVEMTEAARKDYPNEDWLHLTALIHDLGKVLLLPSFGGLPQWTVVGDSFSLGCAFQEANTHFKLYTRQEHTKAIEDVKNFKWQEIFHKYVLYSKSNVRIDVEKVKPYYMSLIEKVGMKNFSDACILSYILFNRNKPPFSAIFCTHFSFLCLQYFPQSSNGKDNRKWR